ncbi:MAG: peptide chain release factor N(5)-glutamine methyltransferase [Gemmataceae bacterium]
MSTEQPWTIGRLLTWTTDFLKSKGAAEARLDALLLAHVLGCDKIALYTRLQRGADRTAARPAAAVQRRAKGCPVAYLLGEREFFSLTFEVTPDVLIPRGDTGVLVNECLDAIKPLPQPRVLDVGTGSGCVAVAVAKQDKRARVTATDVSPKALAVARRNADRHKVEVRFLEGDLFAAVPPGERFDVIVSNPPYIRRDVLSTLAAEVRDHEPRLALDGGDDGFAVIDRLVAGTGSHLAPNGWLIFEIGHDQEAEALARLGRAGWAARATHDAAGHPRVMRARRA